MVQPVPTKAVLQPAKAAAMCTTCHDYACPPPFISPFLLAQDLSSKQIALTDKMRPKSDNAKNHHQWLKGYYWIINKHSSEAEYSETTTSYQLIHNNILDCTPWISILTPITVNFLASCKQKQLSSHATTKLPSLSFFCKF